ATATLSPRTRRGSARAADASKADRFTRAPPSRLLGGWLLRRTGRPDLDGAARDVGVSGPLYGCFWVTDEIDRDT
uniref:Uncharacterized protein n=1 Tax=Oryza brachyantha TaxID=4533 RepID=J3N459_ORYBR